MREISLSLNLLDSSGTRVKLPEHVPLRDILPGMLDVIGARDMFGAALDQCLLLVNRPVLQAENTLYELGAQTGDFLCIAPETSLPDDEPTVCFNVFRDCGESIEISEYISLADALPHLLDLPERKTPFPPGSRVTATLGRPVPDLDATPQQLGIRPGDWLSLVQVRLESSEVTLVLAVARSNLPPFRVNFSPALLGRFDRNMPDQAMIDVSRALPRGKERSVSRRQAEFIEENGVWSVQLHAEASVPMFVDNQRVLPNRRIPLTERNVLMFGPSPNQPDFQLVVRFETE